MDKQDVAICEEQHREETAEAACPETVDELGDLGDNLVDAMRANADQGCSVDQQLGHISDWAAKRASSRHYVVDAVVDPMLSRLARALGSRSDALSAIEFALATSVKR